uniref:Chromogranin-A n=1 Tax=Monodelphis domestica TaxID=13616 RepID=A0A5F8GJW5_MONDO
MSFPAFLLLLGSIMQGIALPVNSPANKSDTKVMRCIVEVISDTLSKPSPLPISEDCFETLRGDERIISILRHQNLLKELQELAIQGANERAQLQKKDRGFEDELSEVLGKQHDEETTGKGQPDLNGKGKVGQEEVRSQEEKGLSRRSEEDTTAPEDIFSPRVSKSQELEEEFSKEWDDSKRWNKMDELARELTAKKRLEESNSEEEPDRSMKLSFRSHKYDFGSPMGLSRRTWKAHSREDSTEAGLPLSLRGDPDEKKEEEGSANRRTEDQELESLAAIEAELEKVAHKLHELRRG